MNYMLQGVVEAGTGTAANFGGMTIAGKTGTTSENYDRWFVGYTPYYTASVWTGYKQNEKMKTNGNPSVQLWRKVMQPLHEGLPNKSFDVPNGVVSLSYCQDSGMLATDACRSDPRGSRETTGYYVRNEDAPTEYCTLHTTVEVCTSDPILDESGVVVSYHMAGENCPAETRMAVVRLNYVRMPVGEAVTLDEAVLLSTLEGQGTCAYHSSGYVPVIPIDPVVPTEPVTDPSQTETPPVTEVPTPSVTVPDEQGEL